MSDTQDQQQTQASRDAGVLCLAYRPINKGAMLGVCDLEIIKWHLVFRECKHLLGKDGGEFIALPSSSFTTRDGATRYKNLVEFADKQAGDRFKTAALAAVKAFK